MKKITSQFPGLKVLLVEDYFINQEVTKDLLEMMQCDVEIAEDGSQALFLTNSKSYDLIIMDLQIPGVDGLEVTRRIRKSGSKEKRPIIIALTASALEGDREKCFEAGMDDYLSKPIEGEKLEEALRKYFPSKMTVTA